MIVFDQEMTMDSLKNETFRGAILVNGTKDHAGFVTFKPLTGKVCKIGYEVFEAFRGQGIASAALSAMVDKAQSWGFETIITGVRSDNLVSKAVLFKNGFRVDYITDEADGKYYQCRLEHSWTKEAKDAYWFR